MFYFIRAIILNFVLRILFLYNLTTQVNNNKNTDNQI